MLYCSQDNIRSEKTSFADANVAYWRVNDDEISINECAVANMKIGSIINENRRLHIGGVDNKGIGDGRVVFLQIAGAVMSRIRGAQLA